MHEWKNKALSGKLEVVFPVWQEVAEPLQDLKEGMEQLEKNKTFRFILSAVLGIGNFLNGSKVSTLCILICKLFFRFVMMPALLSLFQSIVLYISCMDEISKLNVAYFFLKICVCLFL